MSSGTAKAQEQDPTLESEAPSSEGREEGKDLLHTFSAAFARGCQSKEDQLGGISEGQGSSFDLQRGF